MLGKEVVEGILGQVDNLLKDQAPWEDVIKAGVPASNSIKSLLEKKRQLPYKLPPRGEPPLI